MRGETKGDKGGIKLHSQICKVELYHSNQEIHNAENRKKGKRKGEKKERKKTKTQTKKVKQDITA